MSRTARRVRRKRMICPENRTENRTENTTESRTEAYEVFAVVARLFRAVEEWDVVGFRDGLMVEARMYPVDVSALVRWWGGLDASARSSAGGPAAR